VVGIAGGPEKCAYVTDVLGFDDCIDYKAGDIGARLKAACPDGIDVDFENVGGEILDAVLTNINLKARIVLCGLIAQYNAKDPVPGPYNFPLVLMKRARVEGFIIIDFMPRLGEFAMQMAQWLMEGKIKDRVDINDGLENAVTILGKLFTGGNTGKLLVRVSPEP
jgi:NADPH-dependent curcumin reductase CurA